MEFSEYTFSENGSFDDWKVTCGNFGAVGDLRHGVLSSQYSTSRSSTTMPSVPVGVPVSAQSNVPVNVLEISPLCSNNRKYTGEVWQEAVDVGSLTGSGNWESLPLSPSLPPNLSTTATYSENVDRMELLQLEEFNSYANAWDSGCYDYPEIPLTHSSDIPRHPGREATEFPTAPSLSICNATECLPQYYTNNTDQSLESEQINSIGMESPDWTEEDKLEMFAQLQEVAAAIDKPSINRGLVADTLFLDQAVQTMSASTRCGGLFSLRTEPDDSLSDSELESLVASSLASEQVMLNSSPVAESLESWLSGGDSSPASSVDHPVKPGLAVIKEPPRVYRPRYEKESDENPKGYLRDECREAIAVRMRGVESWLGDLILVITVVTSKGHPHPTIYPTCFGKTMPVDWVEDKLNRTVMTVLRADEDYEKKLKYLGVKRNTLQSVDLTQTTRQELTYFRVKFQVQVPSATGEVQSSTTETRQIQAVCPGTMTKLRRRQAEQMQAGAQFRFAYGHS